MDATHDVVIIGGGPAGLSAALTLARARRSVLVIDAGEPRNAPAAHAHGLLGSESRPPLEILAQGRADAAAYGAEIVDGRVHAARRVTADDLSTTVERPAASFGGASASTPTHAGDGPHFVVEWSGGTAVARRLLLASGLVDELPDVPGVRERWGRDVLHCPYCHGWEVRDQRIGILATSPMSVHQALLFRQWSPYVTFLEHTVDLTDDQREELTARGVPIVAGEVTGVVTGTTDAGHADDADHLTGVTTSVGGTVPLDALVVAPRMVARVDAVADLGLDVADVVMGEHVVGSRVVADPTGQTSVEGVWTAGNATDVSAQVVHSAAAGVMAAARINADLVMAETRHAVELSRRGG